MKETTDTVKGFSLVELAIVLVVLGLLVGGVLGGKSLIRAAELRSITTQYNTYYSATRAFRDKYFALPGDMPNATSFWGTGGAGCPAYTSTDTTTCNGNGDGKIMNGPPPNGREAFTFWKHLSNAGLIEGQYAGDSVAYCDTAACPALRVGGFWYIQDQGTISAFCLGCFLGEYGNSFVLITKNSGYNLLTPQDVWNIDTKMDDGRPATGKMVVLAAGLSLTNCTDTALSTNMAANYLLTSEVKNCTFYLRQQF